MNLRDLAAKWDAVPAAERANYQLYAVDLAEALGVERPQPRGSGYEFEFPINIVNPNGTATTKFADLYKAGHFLLEAKDEGSADSRDVLLRSAFSQVRNYAAWIPGAPPPYLLVLDVGKTLMVWDNWGGSYGDYHAGRRISLPTLADRPDDIALLRDIWSNPVARDPRGRSEAVTRDIAAHLAELAASLEARGRDPELVARFLIRCVFTMFAEDVDLLPDEPFRQSVQIGLANPEDFAPTVERLWKAMDEGGQFGLRTYLRFNGHFFRDQRALPLTQGDLHVLAEAARANWAEVEPSIMGTLLTRALDPAERHKLGAEYTPREFVERLVRPTVEEPVRERWTSVQAEVLQLRHPAGKSESVVRKHERQALDSLRAFHGWVRKLRFLDPACGSGNFLYVTLSLVKQIELEVIRAIEEITHAPEIAIEEVNPSQFFGIEVKAWAREIAELTLWIGFHQWWRRTHGHVQPPEPVLEDTGTLEHRDAVLTWDDVVHVPDRDRPDPTPRVFHPVTGKLIPAPGARLQYGEHRGARAAEWPRADFIVGNPPYLGNKRMREVFGDGYVDALRAAYEHVPDTADYVMYWWHRAALEVASGRTIRAGLITTNSITQPLNRGVVAQAMANGAAVVWAAPDHPWVDEADGAQVRVAMTAIAKAAPVAVLVRVNAGAHIVREVVVRRLNSDLSAHADVAAATAVSLTSNRGLSSRGFTLVGRGFVLKPSEASQLLVGDGRNGQVIRPYVNGKDLTKRPRGVHVIDFAMLDEAGARTFPVLYDIIRSRVQPDRDANNRKAYRDYWWRFGEPRPEWRRASESLPRYVATPYVSKHRFFTFLDSAVAPDEKVVVVASADAYHLGVLSSRAHLEWALAAGARLGVGNDPTYNNSLCFDPFPFPDSSSDLRRRISEVAERLVCHREQALGRDPAITMTVMYNVVEKLRTGDPLTASERTIHELSACGVLKDLHDELDSAVAAAYGWTWPMKREEVLERLVALHDERVLEEKAGVVRWLRPDYQIPRFGLGSQQEQTLEFEAPAVDTVAAIPEWPNSTVEQIGVLQSLLARGPHSVDEAMRTFRGARRDHVVRHLETLVIMGEAIVVEDGVYQSPVHVGPAESILP